jgi:hypothetical protein
MARSWSLSSLQKKGVFVLSLLLIAESVTFSNAVKLWFNYQSWLDEHGRKSDFGGFFKVKNDNSSPFLKAQECLNEPAGLPVTKDARCPVPPSMAATNALYPRSRLSKLSVSAVRRFADDCCVECSNCMEPSRAMKECQVLRGGHSGNNHAAETVAEAVAKEAGVTPYGIPLHLWKIIFQAILTTINVACWLLPLRSKKMSENKLGLSLANAFSGGVFLSLAFGHLIPECVHGFSDFQEAVPYMLVLGGYLLIFFVEKVMATAISSKERAL